MSEVKTVKVYIDGVNGAWIDKEGNPFFFEGINEDIKVEIPEEMAKEYGAVKARYYQMNRELQNLLRRHRENGRQF